MRYQTLLAAALCMFGFANANGCLAQYNDQEITEINEIADELNITPCAATDVYNYINNAYKFGIHKGLSDEECHDGCVNEATNLNVLGESVVNDLVSICEKKCYVNNMEMETTPVAEPESELINLVKRANPCDPIAKGKVALVKSNFKFGYNQYQDKGTKKTALSQVNGCGPKKAVFGISDKTMKKIPLLLDGTFEPACNMHDICYVCKKGKATCDKRFKSGMYNICNKKWPAKTHIIKNKACKAQALIFYEAVNLGGKGAYNGRPVNPSVNCAACGVAVIKNKLVKTPFYRKK